MQLALVSTQRGDDPFPVEAGMRAGSAGLAHLFVTRISIAFIG